jgi:argininosuccinate lyase
MALWDKGYEIDKEVLAYTVGNDPALDQTLVPYDCAASAAHAKMLEKIGVLAPEELAQLLEGLEEITVLWKRGEFVIKPEDEDCHTSIENILVAKYGDVGKKIHTARSRNDQVLVALRLYEKEALAEIRTLLVAFARALPADDATPMPGYTHMQPAMPTTVGMWLGSFASAAEDDIKLLDAVLDVIDQNPLGTGAGFGIPVFEIDRDMTTYELGFERLQDNPMYAQLSRGKFESSILGTLSQIMFDMNKLATDVILFSMKEIGLVSLPEAFCTGSSVMPQKRNPDVLELTRANYHVVVGQELTVKSLIGNLISGYNRDMQLIKEPLFQAVNVTKQTVTIMTRVVQGMSVNADRCAEVMTEELFATEKAYELVKEGIPFRDAFRTIAEMFGRDKK